MIKHLYRKIIDSRNISNLKKSTKNDILSCPVWSMIKLLTIIKYFNRKREGGYFVRGIHPGVVQNPTDFY